MSTPCVQCGACCAYFRVSFYWSETAPFLAGETPAELTEPLDRHRCAMRGTLVAPLRCVALEGLIGEQTACAIYTRRPSPCRELTPWDEDGQVNEKCSRARVAHGLPPLAPLTGKPLESTPPLGR